MTLLGAAVGSTAGVVVNRSAIAGSRIASEEAKIRTDSGVSTFTYGANRQHFRSVTDAFAPTTEAGGSLIDDANAGRLPIVSMKVDAIGSWAMAATASPTTNVTMYNAIVAFANGAKAWQDTYRESFVFTLHHEGNDTDVTNASISGSTVLATGIANWQAAMQNIMAIFVARDVRMWTGNNAGITFRHGCMPVMILSAGETSGHKDDFDLWWAPSWTWGNNNLVGGWADAYNKEPVFKAFSYIFSTYKTWTDAKRTSQAALGKTFLAGIAETGCAEFSEYTSTHSSWTATGLAATKANWFINMAAYVRTSWPLLFAACLYDSQKAGVGETPWMLDTSTGAWTGWITATQDAAWEKIITLPAGDSNYVTDLTIPVGTTLRMAPNVTSTVIVDAKNIVVRGRLKAHPLPSATHTFRITNINEAGVVGGPIGGMSRTPVATDPGVWVVDNGMLDLNGIPKAGWNRTGDDPTWLSTDDMRKVPWAAGDYTTYAAHTKGGALGSIVGPDGVTYRQEAINLTRNVVIEGTSGHRTHVFISTDVPQDIEYTRLNHVGPRDPVPGSSISVKIRGRWGLHFHHLMDQGYDSFIRGVVVVSCGSHAFVPHATHGITFEDCIQFLANETGYWWDSDVAEDRSHDVNWLHCMAAGQTPIPDFRGGADLSGFLMGNTTGTARDCVAVGGRGNDLDSSGFGWPSGSPSGPGSSGKWVFEDCIAHNNQSSGLFMWLNASSSHTMKRFVAFRNAFKGVQGGAYVNGFHWETFTGFENVRDFAFFAVNGTASQGHQRGEDFTVNTVEFGHHKISGLLPGHGPGLLVDSVVAQRAYIKEFVAGDANEAGKYDIVNCVKADGTDLEPADWTVTVMQPGAQYRVQRRDLTAYQVNPDGTTTVIPTFYFNITTPSLTQATQGVSYSQALASTSTVDNNSMLGHLPIAWGLRPGSGPLPPGLALSASGVLSGMPTVAGSYPIEVLARDVRGKPTHKEFTLIVAASAALQVTTVSLPVGDIGTPYSAPPLAASGGIPPYTFALTAGSLPPGLSLSPSGAITGTPTTAGSYLPTFRVTDSTSAVSAPRQLGITIQNLNPVFTTPSLGPGEQGLVYVGSVDASDGAPPYMFSVVLGPLPPGIVLSSAGDFSGTPTAFGEYPVRLRVTDSSSHSAQRDYTLTMYQALELPTAGLPAAFVGEQYAVLVPVIGGVPPLIFDTVNTVGMPPGLTISSDGVISGTPIDEGEFTFGIGVSDQLGETDSATGSIEVLVPEVVPAMDRRRPNAFVLRHPLGGSYVRDRTPA